MPDHTFALKVGPLTRAGSFSIQIPPAAFPNVTGLYLETVSVPADIGSRPVANSGIVEYFGWGKAWGVTSTSPNGVAYRLESLYSQQWHDVNDLLALGHITLLFFELRPGLSINYSLYQ